MEWVIFYVAVVSFYNRLLQFLYIKKKIQTKAACIFYFIEIKNSAHLSQVSNGQNTFLDKFSDYSTLNEQNYLSLSVWTGVVVLKQNTLGQSERNRIVLFKSCLLNMCSSNRPYNYLIRLRTYVSDGRMPERVGILYILIRFAIFFSWNTS